MRMQCNAQTKFITIKRPLFIVLAMVLSMNWLAMAANATSGLDGKYPFTDLAPGACQSCTELQPLAPSLSIPSQIPASPGDTVTVPVSFSSDGHSISSMLFSIDFDQTWLAFDPTDSDGDGIPDAININVSPVFLTAVSYNPANTEGELEFALIGFGFPAPVIPDGEILTIDLHVGAPPFTLEAQVGFATDPPPSFGNTIGQSIPGSGIDGSVLISSPGSVSVVSFTAQQQSAGVTLRWQTASEQGNEGFHVERSDSADGVYQRLTTTPIPSQSVGGQGASYEWFDGSAPPGDTHWYRLVTVPDDQFIGPIEAQTNDHPIYLPLLVISP